MALFLYVFALSDARDILRSCHTDSKMYYRINNQINCELMTGNFSLIGDNRSQYKHRELVVQFNKHFEGTTFTFRAAFAVQRRWLFYVLRVIFVLAIISFTSNFCFLFGDIEETLSGRFAYISTSLLSTVAYIFIVSDFVPFEYLTFLDYYIYFTFGFIFMISLETTTLSISDNFAGIKDIDWKIARLNLIIWTGIHVLYMVMVKVAHRKELEKFHKFQKDVDIDRETETMIKNTKGHYDKADMEENQGVLNFYYLRN